MPDLSAGACGRNNSFAFAAPVFGGTGWDMKMVLMRPWPTPTEEMLSHVSGQGGRQAEAAGLGVTAAAVKRSLKGWVVVVAHT